MSLDVMGAKCKNLTMIFALVHVGVLVRSKTLKCLLQN